MWSGTSVWFDARLGCSGDESCKSKLEDSGAGASAKPKVTECLQQQKYEDWPGKYEVAGAGRVWWVFTVEGR